MPWVVMKSLWFFHGPWPFWQSCRLEIFQVLSLWTREEETKKEEEGRIVQEQGPVYGAGNWDECDMSGTAIPLFLQPCWYYWTTMPDPSIMPTPPKTNMDTQQLWFLNGDSFQIWPFLVSMFLNFWGVLMRILSLIEWSLVIFADG